MPSVKDYVKKPKRNAGEPTEKEAPKAKKKARRRRPGREGDVIDLKKAAASRREKTSQQQPASPGEAEPSHQSENHSQRESSESRMPHPWQIWARTFFPKPYEVGEQIYESWRGEGDFSDLPIDHPVLKEILVKGLDEAKVLEFEWRRDPKIAKWGQRIQMIHQMIRKR